MPPAVPVAELEVGPGAERIPRGKQRTDQVQALGLVRELGAALLRSSAEVLSPPCLLPPRLAFRVNVHCSDSYPASTYGPLSHSGRDAGLANCPPAGQTSSSTIRSRPVMARILSSARLGHRMHSEQSGQFCPWCAGPVHLGIASRSGRCGGVRGRSRHHAGSATPCGRDRVAEFDEFALHAPVPPRRVVRRDADHELADRGCRGRPSGPPPVRVVPFAGDQSPVPGQQRAGVTAKTSPHRRRGIRRDSAASHSRSAGG